MMEPFGTNSKYKTDILHDSWIYIKSQRLFRNHYSKKVNLNNLKKKSFSCNIVRNWEFIQPAAEAMSFSLSARQKRNLYEIKAQTKRCDPRLVFDKRPGWFKKVWFEIKPVSNVVLFLNKLDQSIKDIFEALRFLEYKTFEKDVWRQIHLNSPVSLARLTASECDTLFQHISAMIFLFQP